MTDPVKLSKAATAFDKVYLPLIGEWSSPQILAARMGKSRMSAGGIAGNLSHAVRNGYAEWRLAAGVSEFRITPAGLAALEASNE